MKKNLIKKDLPDPGKYSILPPDMDYIYFDGADDFPFNPEEKDYSPVNAWHLAEASFLAYSHPGFARMAFKLAGLPGFRFFGGKTTECFVAWNEGFIIAAFRGTELKSLTAFSEILTDLDAAQTGFSFGGKVHRGFLNALHEIWNGKDGLETFLKKQMSEKPERPLFITGHSLGGALATLAFAWLKEAAALYTFGSPRVGNVDFVSLLDGRTAFRVVNAGDPITEVPPEAGRVFSFRHAGKPVYISEAGDVGFSRDKFIPTEFRDKAVKTISSQAKTTFELAVSGAKNFIVKDNIAEWEAHFSKSASEWSEYLNGLDRITGLNPEKHAPVYYALKLRNAMPETEMP